MKRLNLLVAALITTAVGACAALDNGPSAHTEALDVEAQAQQTERMQAAIDSACAGLTGNAELQCALAVLQNEQPDRWTPEDAERARAAADYITNHPTN